MARLSGTMLHLADRQTDRFSQRHVFLELSLHLESGEQKVRPLRMPPAVEDETSGSLSHRPRPTNPKKVLEQYHE